MSVEILNSVVDLAIMLFSIASLFIIVVQVKKNNRELRTMSELIHQTNEDYAKRMEDFAKLLTACVRSQELMGSEVRKQKKIGGESHGGI